PVEVLQPGDVPFFHLVAFASGHAHYNAQSTTSAPAPFPSISPSSGNAQIPCRTVLDLSRLFASFICLATPTPTAGLGQPRTPQRMQLLGISSRGAVNSY